MPPQASSGSGVLFGTSSPPALTQGSNHVDAVPAARHRPLTAVGEAGVVGGGAVHVRGLELHLAGGDGGVELHLSPVHHVEHQADADDNLKGWSSVSRLRSGHVETGERSAAIPLTCSVNTK